MKTTIKTSVLKDMMSKVIKGVANNKMLPVTSLIGIEKEDNVLRLMATDSLNTIIVEEPIDENDNFSVTMNADLLYKLVSKTTKDTITFEVSDDSIVIKADGKYSVELILDENGNAYTFPKPNLNMDDFKLDGVLSKDNIDTILKTNSMSVSSLFSDECYTGYYIKDKVVTSDGYQICNNNIEVTKHPILLNKSTVSLLINATKDIHIMISDKSNWVILFSEGLTIYSHTMNDINKFKIDDISYLINVDMPYKCTIDKTKILKALDRLSLFIGVYDRNVVNITIEDDKLTLRNLQNNCSEDVPINNSSCKYSFNIDIEKFKNQISAYPCDEVVMYFGLDNCIKFVGGVTIQLLSLEE